MAWFADLAGKAEHLLMNLDEQAGAALRNHHVLKQTKHDRPEYSHHVEPPWAQRKRPIPRSIKTIPSRKHSPTGVAQGNNLPVQAKESSAKSPKVNRNRKLYNLNNCPQTLVGDIKDCDNAAYGAYGYRPRRHSFPTNLSELSNECLTVKMENLEVENEMLKNELNVTNRETKELLERLHNTKEELLKTTENLENIKRKANDLQSEKDKLLSQLQKLKTEITDTTFNEIQKFKEQKRELETEVSVLRETNADLEDLIKRLNEKNKEKDSVCVKVENDLRHAHSTINVLQADLEKSKNECQRLEKEWESYKHRVKSMLAAKDKEIKTMQQGVNFSEDTKVLVEQIERLKEEREVLSEAVSRVRGECEDMQHYMKSLESRHSAAERVVAALRDALKDERAARNRAEAQCNALCKDLKSIQIETGQTIASLRTALRDKDQELSRVKESSSSFLKSTSDSSGLNVADYVMNQDSDDSEKMLQLTHKLFQKQSKIDKLMADNNMLKIQIDKLESKHKSQLQVLRAKSHSVVQLQDTDRGRRGGAAPPARWLAGLARRYPVFRTFLIIYMICLHFWVLTILFTSTPDTYSRSYYTPVLNPQI